MAYEGLAGHRPFTGTTPVDIAAAHVNNPVPPLPDSVDVQLREFVMSMLAKDPLDRPEDALVVSRTLTASNAVCSTSRPSSTSDHRLGAHAAPSDQHAPSPSMFTCGPAEQ